MEFKIQHYACGLCKKEQTRTLLKKQGFTIVRCTNCGFVYVDPRIADQQLPAIYQHNYFTNRNYGYEGYEQEKKLRIKNFERWLNDASAFLPAGDSIKALDVGCAAGYCLDIIRSKGWHAEGLELDVEMCDKLRQAGHKVSQIDLASFSSTTRFSIITLFDVIEHIPAIDVAFRRLNELLDDDGIIVMVTPDHNSIQRKLFGKRWFQYKPIEHIQYFTRESLSAFAERNGLHLHYHTRSGQYANTQFLINRLNHYHFPLLASFFNGLFGLLRLKHRYFYPGTGSLFAVFKKK
jgi:2-polyprenyl-3-methyl-5-hydroxy-6-metoxy-1,4-benzoquinol methylase